MASGKMDSARHVAWRFEGRTTTKRVNFKHSLFDVPVHRLDAARAGYTICGNKVPDAGPGITLFWGCDGTTCSGCLDGMTGRPTRKIKIEVELDHDTISAAVRNFQETGGLIKKLPDQVAYSGKPTAPSFKPQRGLAQDSALADLW